MDVKGSPTATIRVNSRPFADKHPFTSDPRMNANRREGGARSGLEKVATWSCCLTQLSLVSCRADISQQGVAGHQGADQGAATRGPTGDHADRATHHPGTIQKLERQQRQEIFAAEDEVYARRDRLVDDLERRMAHRTGTETLFSVRWAVT